MRRADKEITDRSKIDEILNCALVCRIAINNADYPYIVPLIYGYDGNALYFHSSKEGKKIELIKKNGKICVEVDVETKIIPDSRPCAFSMQYKSVIVFGTCEFISDYNEKCSKLQLLMSKYSDLGNWEFNKRIVSAIEVIKVSIDRISGKSSFD
ncbi:MAG: pyridoxamine 5'-phosphate oxidase family protein [Candidatus Lokiarchaeota archaeon]|nr:pyridoxamine 5'-phosphate oxidase family protein [Candidatus Lokiarchaeota archaeon]